jgi:hypothetical protein
LREVLRKIGRGRIDRETEREMLREKERINMFTGIRHEEAVNHPKARVDVFAEFFLFRFLTFRHFELIFNKLLATFRTIGKVPGMLPVSNQELKYNEVKVIEPDSKPSYKS